MVTIQRLARQLREITALTKARWLRILTAIGLVIVLFSALVTMGNLFHDALRSWHLSGSLTGSTSK